jgi:tetratricopeptide (TPR) repeat protein
MSPVLITRRERKTIVLSLLAIVLLAFAQASTPWARAAAPAPTVSHPDRYRTKLRPPASLESILKQLTPGGDAFPEEKEAAELAGRLAELTALLRARPGAAAEAADLLLGPTFKGGRLVPAKEVSAGSSPRLEIFRGEGLGSDLTYDRTAFKEQLAGLVDGLDTIETAEFLITGITVGKVPGAGVRTSVRYDIVGSGKGAWRAERLGHWQMLWRREADGRFAVAEWTALDDEKSRATDPVFNEVTEPAFGRIPAFRGQLVPGLDYWASTLDSVFQPGGMGHHGVSVGDFDGDGLDDLYVSQPEGLPGRLFRNKGDGTFEDATEAAGLGILDRTSASLFADVDNDGDQDLILLTRSGPLLFKNDGKGHFRRDADAFRFKGRLQGSLTSAAMVDYDRDGFLDLYLCAYGYFIGVSEDKAGPPSPYHDALNGSPNVLLRNDGHGRFVDVTEEAGLDENNDRFSFAPVWADYDEDGWPDLLVANDFGRKNLYRNLGKVNGTVRFKDVAKEAGVEDYGAGMSATFLDYDNDGHLDIYTGNMWTAAGQRVTGLPGFMPDASQEIRDIYRRHVRGNALFRNKGDGTFEDVTLKARAEMGRWAWSSDAFDFDNDGSEDLYVVNGMFTRSADEESIDVDSFFWRETVSQSPLTRRPGTPYDDGWRATNRLLVTNGAQAQHERNVFLRNDGKGGFDDVSGSVGLDLDQDGRSFAVFDYDQDGDPDVVVMAPRSSPQLRLFRNDFQGGNAALALRLVGKESNRDAAGARVTVETEALQRTKVVHIGSGFISQHSKELLFGLGKSQKIVKVTISWPSGRTQALTDLPLNHRVWVEEGAEPARHEPFRESTAGPVPPSSLRAESAPPQPAKGAWLYEPYPAPDFTLTDLRGTERSLKAVRGKPVLLLFWATSAPVSRAALDDLVRGRAALAGAGVEMLAVAVDPPADEAKVRAAAGPASVPIAVATEEVAGTYGIVSRYLFDRREDMRLPTSLLLDGKGEIVKVYRDRLPVAQVVEDVPKIAASPAERLARAVPFPGEMLAQPAQRNYFMYGLELSEQGYDSASLAAFERAAKLDPIAITFYNLGTLYMRMGQPVTAKGAFERALELQSDYPEASNTLGALLAQSGDVPGAIARFRVALESRPDYADALNNLGYALFQGGQAREAFDLYQRALKARPDFPEAFNNLGIFFGQQGDLARAEEYFKQAVEHRAGYGEAGNNLALVLAARGDSEGAITLLRRLLDENPSFEMTYVTLSRIYLSAGRAKEGTQVLERLLQRNPKNPMALQMLRQIRPGG